jgi:hypothetical protein
VRSIETGVIRGAAAALVGPLVCEAAAARDADVAVMGTRGHGMLKCVRTTRGQRLNVFAMRFDLPLIHP